MNLVQDPWLPFRLKDRSIQVLPITAICNQNVVDFALPREDFQGAAYQFAIGILQTAFAPADICDWHDSYQQTPTSDSLQQAFDQIAHAFNTSGDGPLFMQDFDALDNANTVSVSSLLIEAPGENGLKLNTDHFIKRGIGSVMSLEMAIIALFTLQINAPSGGAGYRTGLRGGGPLTTLLLPQKEESTLWQKLWLNVVNKDFLRYDEVDFKSPTVFPWLAPTKTSEGKNSEIYQHDVHFLHQYWAMPRRIRLEIETSDSVCQITGKTSSKIVSQYRAKNYGGNYTGTWAHPLTPYKWDPKKPEGEHLSVKGQPGGITYKEWDTLTFTSKALGQECAVNVKHFYSLCEEFDDVVSEVPRLWAFAYDMDNMKARCWYSATMPIFSVPAKQQQNILLQIKTIKNIATESLWHCRTQIKTAWFNRPGDAKGDMSMIDLAFLQRTETGFYLAVQQLIKNATLQKSTLTPLQAQDWLATLRMTATDVFDEYALSDLGSERSMAKRIKARQLLSGWLFGGKSVKSFKSEYQVNQLKG